MKMHELHEGDVVPFNRKMKGEMSAGQFLTNLSSTEYEQVLNSSDGENLYDIVMNFAKKNYPNVTILPEDDIPNHAKEYRVIDDDGTDTGWKKNVPPLSVVKNDSENK